MRKTSGHYAPIARPKIQRTDFLIKRFCNRPLTFRNLVRAVRLAKAIRDRRTRQIALANLVLYRKVSAKERAFIIRLCSFKDANELIKNYRVIADREISKIIASGKPEQQARKEFAQRIWVLGVKVENAFKLVYSVAANFEKMATEQKTSALIRHRLGNAQVVVLSNLSLLREIAMQPKN